MDYIGEKELKLKIFDFKNHLEHADRMILSAKFGDGKSFKKLEKMLRHSKNMSLLRYIQ